MHEGTTYNKIVNVNGSATACTFEVIEELAYATTRDNQGNSDRYDEVEVVRTSTGFVLRRSSVTHWQGECDVHEHTFFVERHALVSALDACGFLDREILEELDELAAASLSI